GMRKSFAAGTNGAQVASATLEEADRVQIEAAPVAVAPEQAVGLRARAVPHLLVLAAYTVVTLAATWPMLPNLGGYVISKLDPLYSVWAMGWQAHALVTEPARLLDANIMYPFKGTLAFDELGFAEAVIAAPVYLFTGNPVLSHNALWLLTFILSGYGMWLLVRHLKGSSAAGFVAGVAYAVSCYRMDHLPHR